MPKTKCPHCQYDLQDDQVRFCPNCGQALPPPNTPLTTIEVTTNVGRVSDNARATGLEIGKIFGPVSVLLTGSPDLDAEQMRRARVFLLDRVKSSWVDGVLGTMEAAYASLVPGGRLIELNRRLLPEAVDSFAQPADQLAYLQPGNLQLTREDQITYNSLLILGEPGAGKTAALLQLARDAIVRAEGDPTQQIPVVLDLASWSSNPVKIADWIVHELNTTQYGIPKQIGRRWVQGNQLFLLLDGLDQVSQHQRADCVKAINQFVDDHGLTGIAVTCRYEEYRNLGSQLKLRSAILLEPLTPPQIDGYFESAGPALAGLHEILDRDASLRKLVESPLMLTVMSLTYRDTAAADLASPRYLSARERRAQLFDAYIQRMLKYGGEKQKTFTDAQTIAWLSWLARRMAEHNRSTLWIEQIQPSWLPSAVWQWLYMIGSRLWVGIIGGLLGGIVIGVAGGFPHALGIGFVRGVVEGVIGGLISGLVVGLVDMAWITRISKIGGLGRLLPYQQSAIKVPLIGLVVGSSVACLFWLSFGRSGWLGWSQTRWLFEGLSVGLDFGLSAGLLFGFGPREVRHSLTNDIQTVEHLSWSPKAAWHYGRLGVITGVIAGALGGLVGRGTVLAAPMLERGMSLTSMVLVMMALGVVFLGLVGLVFGGLSGTFIKIEKAIPNQGFRLSITNGTKTGTVVGLIFGVLGLAAGGILGTVEDAVTFALYGVFIGVLAALWYGGLFVIQHTALRLILWATGLMPRMGKLARFLDYAAQRVFLRKVGGGYIFGNRYLEEHFASLAT